MAKLCTKLALVALVVFPAAAPHAETGYIIDQLVIGLREGRSIGSPTIDVLNSGTELAVLTRLDEMVQVRDPEGKMGWVEARYVTNERPAALVVEDLKQQIAHMRATGDCGVMPVPQEPEPVEETDDQARDTLETSAEPTTPEAPECSASPAKGRALEGLPLASNSRRLVGVALLLFGLGFAGGIYTMDYRQRRRHGGFRL